MTTTQWIITLAVTLIAGGAFGSVIGIIATNRRNRVQPIAFHKEIIPFVNQEIGGTGTKAEILLKLDGESKTFSNLTLGRITVENTSNKDYEKFNFGISISHPFSMAVYLQTETQDRYHLMSSSPQIDFNHLDSEIDFVLKPFNRNDRYSATLFIDADDGQVDITPSTGHPINFVEALPYLNVSLTHAVGEVVGAVIKNSLKP